MAFPKMDACKVCNCPCRRRKMKSTSLGTRGKPRPEGLFPRLCQAGLLAAAQATGWTADPATATLHPMASQHRALLRAPAPARAPMPAPVRRPARLQVHRHCLHSVGPMAAFTPEKVVGHHLVSCVNYHHRVIDEQTMPTPASISMSLLVCPCPYSYMRHSSWMGVGAGRGVTA